MTEYYSNVARNSNLKNTCLPSSQSVAAEGDSKVSCKHESPGKTVMDEHAQQVSNPLAMPFKNLGS